MSEPMTVDLSVKARVAAALGREAVTVERLPTSWGSETWRVELVDGECFVAKFGPTASARKWFAALAGQRLAYDAGVPTSRVVYCDEGPGTDDRVLRIFTWLDGHDVSRLTGPDRVRLFTELGRAIRRLHAIELPVFSSRLDGSAPGFARWDQYVEYRLPSVVERARIHNVLRASQLRSIETEVLDMARVVGHAVRPTLCHRDLHPGNFLAHENGALSGVLDFDGAEAWDPAVDFVKLRWQTLTDRTTETTFNNAYLAGEPWPAKWEERVRLAELLELTNALANARADGHGDYEARVRERLQETLGRRG